MANQFNNPNSQNQSWFWLFDKKKSLFIGGMTLALLLIAGGVFYYFYYYQKPPAPTAPIFPSASNGTNPFNDIAAGKKPAPFGCDNEINQIAKDACWQSKAVSEKNVVFCDSIKGTTPFVSKDACINLVVHEKKDKSLCTSIQDTSIKKNCQEIVK